MAGYQTIEALRPILHRGPPSTPVVDRSLFYKPRYKHSPTLQQIRQMVEMRSKGASIRNIALKIGCSDKTCRRHTAKVPPPDGGWSRGGNKSKVNRAKAERMRRAGFTWQEIADEFGVHMSSVQRLIVGPMRKRVGNRHRETEFFEVCVARVTGIDRGWLRKTEGNANKAPAGGAARARVILFWLVRHKKPHLTFTEIARLLGGFDHTTCCNAYHRVERVVADLNLPAHRQASHIVRLLWEAEWPKASA